MRNTTMYQPLRAGRHGPSRAFVAALVIALVAVSAAVAVADATSTALPIPPVLDLREINGKLTGTLVAREDQHEFFPGEVSQSLGYNGSYLGPTIMLRRGESYSLVVENELDEVTTVHWHGLDVRADADGGPWQPIEPGAEWTASIDIHQPAATAWYHPHAIGTTAKQVALGLAGMIIIRDESTDAARRLEEQLPHTYGVDDLPVIVQDKRVDGVGRNTYRPSGPDIMYGYAGNVIVTNGVAEPVATVPAGLVRLRLLNGSNSASHRLDFPAKLNAVVIASDGGYLAEPIAVDSLMIAAGERFEVIVNAGAINETETAWITSVTDLGVSGRALGLETGAPGAGGPSAVTELPVEMHSAPPLVEPGVTISRLPRRRFVMENRGMMNPSPFTINGKVMAMERIDEDVSVGRLEIWEISNVGPMKVTHTFHTHSTAFQVVSVAGDTPPAILAGRKDTVVIPPGVTVEIAVQFDRHVGVFMYHCHMLEHEEAGMMGQFEVVR